MQQCVFHRLISAAPETTAYPADPARTAIWVTFSRAERRPLRYARCCIRRPGTVTQIGSFRPGHMGTITESYQQRLAGHEIEPDAAQAALAARLDDLQSELMAAQRKRSAFSRLFGNG